MKYVYVVNSETGCYSDYRKTPLFFFLTEEEAKFFAEKAASAARLVHEKVEQIKESYSDDKDDEYGEKSASLIQKAIAANKFDPSLDEYDLNDVSYSVTKIAKFGGKL